MGFKFEPQAENALLTKGIYDAVVKRITEKTSKKGEPMLEVIVTVYGPDGAPVDVFAYLVPSIGWKLRQFCEAVGQDYDSGDLDLDKIPDTNIRVAIDVESKAGYDDKNVIREYMTAGLKDDAIESKPRRGGNKAGELNDSDVPF